MPRFYESIQPIHFIKQQHVGRYFTPSNQGTSMFLIFISLATAISFKSHATLWFIHRNWLPWQKHSDGWLVLNSNLLALDKVPGAEWIHFFFPRSSTGSALSPHPRPDVCDRSRRFWLGNWLAGLILAVPTLHSPSAKWGREHERI